MMHGDDAIGPSAHKEPSMREEKQNLAVFVDFENLAIGLRERKERFDIKRVLSRLIEKGNIAVKRAYADWKRYAASSSSLQEAGFDLIEIPARRMTGKNSADMRMCVDAMDLAFSKPHLNTFVIVSGDSDFSPLVSKLRENNKFVIGLGLKDSTSSLLSNSCDEFIFYEDVKARAKEPASRPAQPPQKEETPPEPAPEEAKSPDASPLLLEALETLRAQNRDTLWSSLVKTTIRRKHPDFKERTYGFRNFSSLLEDAQKQGLVKLTRDAADRTYIVSDFTAKELAKPARRSTVRRSRR
jgi:uncharacterized protein (TIGR00288 family)